MAALSLTLRERLARGAPTALVEVARARGSTPREAGAAMLVGADRAWGTIGGGRLEWEAILRARALLDQGGAAVTLEIPLGPAMGQCCGGHVVLRLALAGAAELAALEAVEGAAMQALPTVLLFGAGHVGRALATALAPLPLRLRWVDERAHEFPSPPVAGVQVVLTDRPLAEIEAAPAGSAALVLTHSHALDFTLTEAALRRGDLAYVGLIGSSTKRRRFERGLRELGLGTGRLVCPIGGAALKDKRPAVIAALATAELLLALAAHRAHELQEGAAA
jgi:xanthine dehydrogenase accessory protein XdhC